jgi:hypothetical protein
MKTLGMIAPSAEGTYNEDNLEAVRAMKGLVDYGLEAVLSPLGGG